MLDDFDGNCRIHASVTEWQWSGIQICGAKVDIARQSVIARGIEADAGAEACFHGRPQRAGATANVRDDAARTARRERLRHGRVDRVATAAGAETGARLYGCRDARHAAELRLRCSCNT